jgi:hypothetical protein
VQNQQSSIEAEGQRRRWSVADAGWRLRWMDRRKPGMGRSSSDGWIVVGDAAVGAFASGEKPRPHPPRARRSRTRAARPGKTFTRLLLLEASSDVFTWAWAGGVVPCFGPRGVHQG